MATKNIFNKENEPDLERDRSLSRRQFLKIAGAAGATVGLAGGLGGLLAACGSEETAAGSTSSTEASSSTVATSVSASAETGREIKVGFVTATTGSLGAFGISDEYSVARWREFVDDGVVLGDGLKHPINILLKDSQSDPNRASQVAADLVTLDNVDLLLAVATPDVINPVADQAEALEVPGLFNDCPWQAFAGRGGSLDQEYKWTYLFFWGSEDEQAVYLDSWTQIPHNNVVAALWANDADGNAARPLWTQTLADLGFTLVDGGPFQNGTEDYTSIIAEFKKAGAEILTGLINPPDWANFWKQSYQQGYQPKIVTVGKPMLFPSAIEALGTIGTGLCCDQWFHPTFPFKSSLTGETARDLTDDFEKRTGQQWQIPQEHYLLFELVVDVLKRTKNLDDKEEIVQAIKTINIPETIVGPIDYTAPVKEGTLHPHPNVVKTPLYCGQWVKGEKWPFDLKIVSNAAAPAVPVQGQLEPLVY